MSSELRCNNNLPVRDQGCCNAIIQTLRLKHGRVVIDVLNEDGDRQVGGGAVSPVTGQTEPDTQTLPYRPLYRLSYRLPLPDEMCWFALVCQVFQRFCQNNGHVSPVNLSEREESISAGLKIRNSLIFP